jgi:hypothetical protein
MDSLPLLIRHGALIWVACLCGMVLAAVLGAVQRRRRALLREAEARRDALGEPITRLDGADGSEVTLDGQLHASGVLAVRFEDGAEAAAVSAGSGRAEAVACARAHRLELVSRGAVVRLDGPVEVVVGDLETRTGKTPDALPPEVRRRLEQAGGTWASSEPVVLRSVRSGARVLVQGVLRRGDSGDGPGAYRTGAVALRLTPLPGGEGFGGASASLRLACLAPPRAGEGWVRAPLRAGAAALLLFGAVFVAAPELQGRGPIQGEALMQVLAATPLHRSRALAAYDHLLDARVGQAHPDPLLIDRLEALRLLEGRCSSAVEVLLDHGQWARAEDLAVRCSMPLVAARAAFERGDFARAASIWDSDSTEVWEDGAEVLFGLRVHLLAGDVEGASRVARRAAEQLRGRGIPDLDCIVEALDGPRVPLYGAPPFGPGPLQRVCFGLLDRTWDAENTSLLAIEAGEPLAISKWSARRDPIGEPSGQAPRWALVRAALDRLQDKENPTDGDHLAEARLAAEMATFESACGDHDEALRLVGVARASIAAYDGPAGPIDGFLGLGERTAIEALHGSVLLRAGRLEEARTILAPIAGEPEAEVAAALADVPKVPFGATAEGVRIGTLGRRFRSTVDYPVEDEVIRGDGVRLAAELLQEGGSPRPWVLRVAALTTRGTGSAALSAWLRWGTQDGCHGCSSGARFADVTARLALAEAIGDRVMVAELRAIAGAFRRAFLRRDVAVPLLLLEQIPIK